MGEQRGYLPPGCVGGGGGGAGEERKGGRLLNERKILRAQKRGRGGRDPEGERGGESKGRKKWEEEGFGIPIKRGWEGKLTGSGANDRGQLNGSQSAKTPTPGRGGEAGKGGLEL